MQIVLESFRMKKIHLKFMGETALFLEEGTLVENKSTTGLWMCFCVDKPAKILMDACIHRE